jgi:predicted peptidase
LFGVFFGLCAHRAGATELSHSVTGSVSDGGDTLDYRLFTPTGVAPGAKAPLVLYLHGMGERGTDNIAQTTWMGGLLNATQSGSNAAYVLAPQIDTNQWFQSFSSKPTEAMSLTIDALKQVMSTQNIDPSRVYVTGISMGGMGAWDILAREPKLFAAAVPISGAGDPRTAAAIKDIPVWDFHGSADPLVPVSAAREMIEALQSAGGSPKYTEIAGAGHEIWDSIYQDDSNTLYSWLFSQHLVSAPAASQPISSGEVTAQVITGVPEPTSLTLIMIAGTGLLRRRSRRN